MNNLKTLITHLARSVAALAVGTLQLNAGVPVIPSTYALPPSAINTNQPGFIWNVSEVAAKEPNILSWAESQLAGLQGDNLADPSVVGVASAAAQPPNPSTAPIHFVIPGVINLSKADGTTKGNFTPDAQMPGIPGTTGSTDNIAAEILAYLQLPAGTNTIGVNSDDGFRMTMGGAAPQDKFAVNIGQFEGGRGANDTIFQVVIQQAGYYAARVLYENGGGDANIEIFTVSDGLSGTNKVLVNDIANGGIHAYWGTTMNYAYASKLDPIPNSVGVVANEGIHITLNDGAAPVAQSSIALTLDGAAVSPMFTRNGAATLIDFTPAAPWDPLSTHTATLSFTDGAIKATNTWNFTVQSYISLDPGWAVTGVDTNKPGFIWSIFANPDAANTVNSNERAELDLSLQATDANGALLANLADPSAKGTAIGAGTAPSTPSAPVKFEVATTVNFDIANTTMPGAPSTDGSTAGQAGELLTYLALPAGIVHMEVDSDNGFRLYAGSRPADLFGRAIVAENNNLNGVLGFSFKVAQAGVYPFRMVWANGTGSRLKWSVYTSGGKAVLVNDAANGGIPAYRALQAGAVTPPRVVGASPLAALHQLEIPATNLLVVLADGTQPIDDSSITLTIDGKTVTPVKSRLGSYLKVSDGGAGFPGLQLPADVHSATLTYKDSTGTPTTQTWNFNNIQILNLPATPLVQENFDSYPEATSVASTVPPGWMAWNYTADNTAGWDLKDKASEAYKNWVIISTDTATSIEGGALNNDPNQTINGQPVANFASGNILWATSDGRSGVQAQFCVSAPFNLSSITNPVLIYSSLMRMSANANVQADGIEYSIDDGATWLPGVIYVTVAYNHGDYVKLTQDGSIDVGRTLNQPYPVLNWVNPVTLQPGGGTFGSGLAEPITQSLATYMAPRTQTTVTSTKVDGIRLPMASHQKSVRLRFYQVGNCSWWWGVDNLAFYDIAPPVAPSNPPHIDSIQTAGGMVTIKWSNGGSLESSPALSNPVWTSTGNSSGTYSEAGPSGNKFYRVRR